MPTRNRNPKYSGPPRRSRPARSQGAARTVRLVVADDQTLDRIGLVRLLETQRDLKVVGQAASGEEAVSECRARRPHVLLLDLRMPGLDGISAIPMVLAASPATRILAVAERGEGMCLALNPPRPGEAWGLDEGRGCGPVSDCLQLAVARGAMGAIRRSAEPEDLFQAIRALASGNAWYEPGTASRMLEHARNLEAAGDPGLLSRREHMVAVLIADGRSNKEIAAALEISVPTVKKHVGHILGKLGLDDRLQVGLHLARNPLILYPLDRTARRS